MESGRKDSGGQWEEGEHHWQQQGTVFSMQGSCVCIWTGAAQDALERNCLYIDTMRWRRKTTFMMMVYSLSWSKCPLLTCNVQKTFIYPQIWLLCWFFGSQLTSDQVAQHLMQLWLSVGHFYLFQAYSLFQNALSWIYHTCINIQSPGRRWTISNYISKSHMMVKASFPPKRETETCAYPANLMRVH